MTNQQGVGGRDAYIPREVTARVAPLSFAQKSLRSFVHKNKAEHIDQTVTHYNRRLERWFVETRDKPAEPDGEWEIHKSIIPPRKRRQHEADESQQPTLPFSFPCHHGGKVRRALAARARSNLQVSNQ